MRPSRPRRLRALLAAAPLLAAAAACTSRPGASPPPSPSPSPSAPSAPSPGAAPAGRTPEGASARLELDGERIIRLAPAPGAEAAGWLWPPVVDSHVHLAYWPVADRLAAAGVAAAVDLAAPTVAAAPPLHVIAAGPMLTAPGGYPLDDWGPGGDGVGYGAGCADAACVTATIDRLAAAGAGVIKVAADEGGLDPALLPAAVAAAHAHRLKIAAHALSARGARRAAAAGADLLAHTPVEPLPPDAVAAWRGRAVISTLAAFGGGAAAVANLRALRAAGVTVLYGTDLGNLRDAGPSAAELDLLRAAGLDDAAITDAMTTAPARYWGLPLGALAPGAEASLLVLERDPRTDARALLAPRAVWLRGRRLR